MLTSFARYSFLEWCNQSMAVDKEHGPTRAQAKLVSRLMISIQNSLRPKFEQLPKLHYQSHPDIGPLPCYLL